MNNISYTEPGTPVLHAVKLEVNEETDKYVSQTSIPTKFDFFSSLQENGLSLSAKEGTHVIKVKRNEVIDFIFQNAVQLFGEPYLHPWHLHLHNMWVLQYGNFETTPATQDFSKLKFPSAVSRNTFSLYPSGWRMDGDPGQVRQPRGGVFPLPRSATSYDGHGICCAGW